MCLGAQSQHPIHLFVHWLIDAAAVSNFEFLRQPSQSSWKHRASIHVQDKVSIFLSISQTTALQQMVATNPMVSSTTVLRCLELLPDYASKISPSKSRLVARAVVAARAQVLLPFSQGGKLDGEEGSLTRLSEKIFLQQLLEQHNQGGKHLELHQLVCVGHQFTNWSVCQPVCVGYEYLVHHYACHKFAEPDRLGPEDDSCRVS
jgi:hypothetical protein